MCDIFAGNREVLAPPESIHSLWAEGVFAGSCVTQFAAKRGYQSDCFETLVIYS